MMSRLEMMKGSIAALDVESAEILTGIRGIL
jgi:hypothetical protein